MNCSSCGQEMEPVLAVEGPPGKDNLYFWYCDKCQNTAKSTGKTLGESRPLEGLPHD